MGQLVQPTVDIVGQSQINTQGLYKFLKRYGLEDFWTDVSNADLAGIQPAESLCSLAAKLCYRSVVPGKNANLTGVRDIAGNLKGVHKTAHMSVLEHGTVNFIFANLSRIATHELVRHRVGAAYSQTSGRYCRLDEIDVVWDPILDPVKDLAEEAIRHDEDTVYRMECRLGLRKPPPGLPPATANIVASNPLWYKYHSPDRPVEAEKWVPIGPGEGDFDFKKKVTSAIRRFAPNGQANEIFVTLNFRSIRHLVQLRTAEGAEREIRVIFGEVYRLTKEAFPTLWYNARERTCKDGLLVVEGMRSNPYDIQPGDPEALRHWSTADLVKELRGRTHELDFLDVQTKAE